MKIYITTVTPRIILFLSEDALSPIVALVLIGLQFRAVYLFVLYLPIAVRAHVKAWPRFLLVGVLTTDAAAVPNS